MVVGGPNRARCSSGGAVSVAMAMVKCAENTIELYGGKLTNHCFSFNNNKIIYLSRSRSPNCILGNGFVTSLQSTLG